MTAQGRRIDRFGTRRLGETSARGSRANASKGLRADGEAPLFLYALRGFSLH